MNNPVNFYYDFNNYLPLGFDVQINDEGDLVIASFGDWETHDEIFVFRIAVFEQGNQLFKHHFKKIEFNNLTDLDSKYSNINQ